MIGLEDRLSIVALIDQACAAVASKKAACKLAGLDPRSLQRWRCGSGLSVGDGRPHTQRSSPSHRLSEAERQQVLATLNELRFADKPPAFIVATLADEGVYLASESQPSRCCTATTGPRSKPPRCWRCCTGWALPHPTHAPG